VPSCAPFLTPLHANGLSLSIRNHWCYGGYRDAEGGNFSEKRERPSTGDRFRFDDFAHGQTPRRVVNTHADVNSKMPVLI
jgi:hypothetical protein